MSANYTITGFTTLGEVTLNNEKYDSEAVALILWSNTTGLHLLQAQGCTCCGDMDEDITPENAEQVDSLEQLATKLYGEWEGLEPEDKIDAEVQIRTALQEAAGKLGGELPRELSSTRLQLTM